MDIEHSAVPGFWRNKRVFITGHTGFKGSWLALWLCKIGAQVTGYALPPGKTGLYRLARIGGGLDTDIAGDIRDFPKLLAAVRTARPEIVFHLAAQPLVRESYENPVRTFETNVMGTVHLHEAVRNADSVKVVINVTSDKCYDNREWVWGYRENDALGGRDPYSASKGCSELVTAAYRRSYPGSGQIAIATARAGNVIGGGDRAKDRLVPDIVRSVSESKPLVIRSPHAVRPWQHVLDPLHGYMMLAEKLWSGGVEFSGAWNFGPAESESMTVSQLAARLADYMGSRLPLRCGETSEPFHEAHVLRLDCSKARMRLGWKPKLRLDEALRWTAEWYKGEAGGGDVRDICLRQIGAFAAKD